MSGETVAIARLKATVEGVQIAYRRAGDGDPVLLLHGCPQTSHAWRHIIPRLARNYTVIAPDLPGLGDSGPSTKGYTKHALAATLRSFVSQLGLGPVRVVGHDMGATVAYAYAAAAPTEVSHLAIIDVMLAGAGFEEFGLDFGKGGGLWHFAFHMTPDVPELLITGRERAYLGQFWWGAAYDPGAITWADAEEYLRCYCAPGALTRFLAYYRSWLEDAEHNRATLKTKLQMPVLGVGGAASMGRYLKTSLERAAESVRTEVIERCGHWVPEERPAELASALESFFKQ